MISRPEYIQQVRQAFKIHPVVALLGPRQCGKTTLARIIAQQESCTFFDLEDPVDLQRLSVPRHTLSKLTGLVIIDEFQRRPELMEILRVVVDQNQGAARFLIRQAHRHCEAHRFYAGIEARLR